MAWRRAYPSAGSLQGEGCCKKHKTTFLYSERRTTTSACTTLYRRKGVAATHPSRISPAKAAGSTTPTTLVNLSPNAHQLKDQQQQQPNALPANVHSPTIHSHQYVVRHSPTSPRPQITTPVQHVAWTRLNSLVHPTKQ